MVENTTQPADWHGYLTPIVFFIGIAAMTWSAVRLRKRVKSPVAAPAPVAQPVRNMDVQHMARELNGLMVDLHETARQIAAQIDNRYAKLDAMVALADERIKKLEAVQANSGEQTVLPVTHETPSRLIPSIGQPALAEADPATPPPADASHQQIYMLCDAGKSVREIAQQLNRPTGEIELILNLRPKNAAAL